MAVAAAIMLIAILPALAMRPKRRAGGGGVDYHRPR